MDRQRLLVDIFVAIVNRPTQLKTNRSAFMLQSVQHDAVALAKSSGTFIRRYRVTHIEEIEQITAALLTFPADNSTTFCLPTDCNRVICATVNALFGEFQADTFYTYTLYCQLGLT